MQQYMQLILLHLVPGMGAMSARLLVGTLEMDGFADFLISTASGSVMSGVAFARLSSDENAACLQEHYCRR